MVGNFFSGRIRHNATLLRAANRLTRIRYWVTGQAVLALLRLLRRLPMERALAFIDGAARRVGPLTGRHRIALDNLAKAFPEKSEDERRAIALDMWGHMGRLAGEYIFLDRLFDFDPDHRERGRIEIVGEENFLKIAGEKAAHIVFTAHLGNFELLPVAAAAFGMKVTALFRPPNNPYIAEYILSTRKGAMGELQPSLAGAAFALSRVLENGGNVGVLVDQKFTNGIRTRFFGRECGTNPLLAKLARHYQCAVYPARCIRLPGNRFRLVIGSEVALPHTEKGIVDVPATAQLLNDIVERWVREDPAQWMWFHKRWDLTYGRRAEKSVSS